MPASYPSSIKTFVNRNTGDVIQAAHVNDLQDEVNAIETDLINGFRLAIRPDSSGNNRDIGLTTARFRDLFLGRTIDIAQGTLTASTEAFSQTVTWNNAAVAFVNDRRTVTDTASDGGSELALWRVGANTIFAVRKTGLWYTNGVALRLGTFGATILQFLTANVDRWRIDTSGHFVPETDGTEDIGSASFRIRDLYAGTSVRVGTTVASAGHIRLPNASFIRWRNTANTGDVAVTVNATDKLVTDSGAFLPSTDNAADLGDGSFRWRDGYFGTSVRLGTTPATAGGVRLPNDGTVTGRNAANTANINAIRVDGGDRIHLGNDVVDILWGVPLVALGGGAAPTFGTIGGAGPATAAQNTWMRVVDTTGAVFWVPAWK